MKRQGGRCYETGFWFRYSRAIWLDSQLRIDPLRRLLVMFADMNERSFARNVGPHRLRLFAQHASSAKLCNVLPPFHAFYGPV
jgi:hypothetical protein